MSSSVLRRIRLPALFGIALGVASMSEGRAQESRTFVIPATTGYGVDERLDDSGECGAAVANAWCNTYGQGVALEFGLYVGRQVQRLERVVAGSSAVLCRLFGVRPSLTTSTRLTA